MRLEVRSASIGYPGNILASDISMVSEDGCITAVLGPNGCGKTTFVKSLMGMVPWLSGGVFLDGTDVNRLSQRERWQKMAYVPQKSEAVSYSVLDMVLLGLTSHKAFFSQPDLADQKKAEAILEKMGLISYADCPYDRLSTGQQQLVKMARALVAPPRLLIMDEPENGLDLKNTVELLSLMKRLCKEENRQIIFITHSPEHALLTADQALLFLPGGTVRGEAKTILKKENLEQAYGLVLRI